jgi:Protein of unknown function (DUF4244)
VLQPAAYATVTIAPATFGVILCAVVTGDSVATALSHVIGRELDTQVLVDERKR